MFGAHWYQLLIVLGIALLFFGPKRLPEMGSSIGKTIKEFQRSMKEVSGPARDAPALLPPPTPSAEAQGAAGAASTRTIENGGAVDVPVPAGRQHD